MNIGVIIAVSEYSGTAGSLPSCARDGGAILGVLQRSNKFEDILYVDGKITGALIKSKISEFVKKHGNSTVDEILFYFSGHGEFFADEFYYVMSDYSPTKRKQSSLENSELDNMIRSLAPGLFVKIVDACHSGTPYIKDVSAFESYLKSPSRSSVFNNIYFMFSSHTDQASYQDDRLSFFTESIISSIAAQEDGPMRYKNIIDFVSDDFANRNSQTPFFVNQAKFTETFINVDNEIRLFVGSVLLPENVSTPTGGVPEKALTLLDFIKMEEQDYCSKEDSSAVIIGILSSFEGAKFSEIVSELYAPDVVSHRFDYPPHSEAIGVWLDKNNSEREFFAKATRERVGHKVKVPRGTADILRLSMMPSVDASRDYYDEVTQYRDVVNGYESTTELPFVYISIRLSPKIKNIAPEECCVGFVISRRRLRFFWSFSHYEYVDWDNSIRVGKMEWRTDEARLRDTEKIHSLISFIIESFGNFVEEYLSSKFGQGMVASQVNQGG